MTNHDWSFDVPPDACVVTTSYVTDHQSPILEVWHELDDEGEPSWQFHCGNGDFSAAVLRLVRLDEILRLDESLSAVADLPMRHRARRSSARAPWLAWPITDE